MSTKNGYKKTYTKIFTFYYLVEGFSQGIPFLVFPPYLALLLGNQFDVAQWLIVAAIGGLPWAIKMIIGLANDKWGSKKYGNRFPWIFSFGVFGAIWWFILAAYLPTDSSIYIFLALYYFMIGIGTAFSDTALDGLILDVTPKETLGRIQGYTWMCLLLGMGAGGMLLGLLFLALNIVPVLFLITGALMIFASFLTKLVKEPPLEEVTERYLGREVLSIFTKKKNWKVIGFTFTSSMGRTVLLTFFLYVILITLKVIDVKSTILSITSGNTVEFLGWTSVFYFFNGLGTFLGSFYSGRSADKNRKKTLVKTYIIYIPFCLLSVLPFLLTGAYIIALIYGLIGVTLFGALDGAIVVTTGTIKADIVKKDYPKLKSTYYALLVALFNGGQSVGSLLGALIFTYLALNFPGFSFYLLFFVISLFGAVTLLISYLLFRTIDPRDYELTRVIGEEKEIYFA
ncbi:MAG: MFS transporter [Promethearchaeota archaeon]|nr:MAG: MFS transporter [Candidatus Lokiarchaeota archaeon]